MSGHLTIVSCGLTADDLSPQYREHIKRADVLAGGQRLLDSFPDFSGERIAVGAHARETALELAARSEREQIVVLASGDSLFFGIGALFVPLVPAERLTVLPNITAAQAALSRLKIDWPQTRFFTAHGRTAVLPWQTVLQSQSAVIYTDSLHTPSSVAADLISHWPAAGGRKGAIVENLGADERITTGSLKKLTAVECGGFSMLVLFPSGGGHPPLPLGLSDETYEHENGLITHPEVRAVILSKLRLSRGILWDLGAGSGSVGIEAAGLCEGLAVHAVEQKEARCGQIRNNAAACGCPSLTVHCGEILNCISSLPAPDRVFIGGGGSDIAVMTQKAFARLNSGGVLVASAVLLETKQALASLKEPACGEIIELDIKRSGPVGTGRMMKPDNPVTLYIFKKDAE